MNNIDIEKLNRDNFKSMMNVLSMPGTIQKVQALFGSDMLAIANTLLYSEVSFYYDGKEDFELIEAITNSKKEDSTSADYIFCDEINEYLFNKGKIGTSKDPEFSSTFVFNVKILKEQK